MSVSKILTALTPILTCTVSHQIAQIPTIQESSHSQEDRSMSPNPLPTRGPSPNFEPYKISQSTISQPNSGRIDGQGPPTNPQAHQTPQLANSQPNCSAIDSQGPPPNPQAHQTPQLTNPGPNGSAIDSQNPPLNPQAHQTPQLTNPRPNSSAIDSQNPTPNLQAPQTPQLANSRPDSSAIEGQNPPPNLQAPQMPQLTNSRPDSSAIDSQNPPPDPQAHQTPQFTNSRPDSIAIDSQNLPPNPQTHQTPQPTNSQPHSAGIDGQGPPPNPQVHQTFAPSFNGQQSFDFRASHQPSPAFQPQQFQGAQFLFSGTGCRNTTRPFNGPLPDQVLGARSRNSSTQASKRRRARSAEPQNPHTLQSPMSTAVPSDVVLQIMEVRDKRTRQELLSDIRVLMAEMFRTPISTGSTTVVPLSQDKILEMINPLLTAKTTTGEYIELHFIFQTQVLQTLTKLRTLIWAHHL
jgi:hypothetical protein